MVTCDRDALLEKLYDEMEMDLQVGSCSVWFHHTPFSVNESHAKLEVSHELSYHARHIKTEFHCDVQNFNLLFTFHNI